MIGYVTRDKEGDIYLHSERPYYDDLTGLWLSTPEEINITNQFPEFNDMSYTDEPIKVEFNIKRV